MKPFCFRFTAAALALASAGGGAVHAQEVEPLDPSGEACPASQIEANKALARGFYRDLWFTDNTDRYSDYLADEYVVHDIGDRKNVSEPAVEQKLIADRFWDGGTISGSIDFQIADCDMVATRWQFEGEPESLMARFFTPTKPVPVINVFRIEDGRIVEIWNHRHDIDFPVTWFFWLQGFGAGMLVALVLAVWLWRTRRRLAKVSASSRA